MKTLKLLNKALWTFMVFQLMPIAYSNESQVTEANRDEVEAILADYTANRAAFSRSAVAAQSEVTYVYRDDSTRNFTSSDWYISCADLDNDRRRYDSIIRRTSNSSFTATSPCRTMFVDGNRVVNWMGHQLLTRVDLKQLSEEERDAMRLSPMVRLDPFNLPLVANATLRTDTFIPTHRHFEDKLKPESLVQYSKDIKRLDVTFVLNKERGIHKAVRFKQYQELQLPVATAVYILKADQSKIELSSARTEWGNLNGKGWVPISVELSAILGSPKKPSSYNDWEVKLFWLEGKQFPDDVFDFRAVPDSILLRDRIVEYAVAMDSAKSVER